MQSTETYAGFKCVLKFKCVFISRCFEPRGMLASLRVHWLLNTMVSALEGKFNVDTLLHLNTQGQFWFLKKCIGLYMGNWEDHLVYWI